MPDNLVANTRYEGQPLRGGRRDILDLFGPDPHLLGDVIAPLPSVGSDHRHRRTRLQFLQTGEWSRNFGPVLPAKHVSPENDVRALPRHRAVIEPSNAVTRYDWDAILIQPD